MNFGQRSLSGQNGRGREHSQSLANNGIEVWKAHQYIIREIHVFPSCNTFAEPTVIHFRFANFATKYCLYFGHTRKDPEKSRDSGSGVIETCKYNGAWVRVSVVYTVRDSTYHLTSSAQVLLPLKAFLSRMTFHSP